MADDDYVLSHTSDASERERLGRMESLVDLPTHRHLATLGIRQGWRCLEIGAGHGAIARWLADQVGPQGRVVATDVDTRFLTDLTLPNVEVRQHDIRTDPLEPGTYDLAHCRTLLMHMVEPHVVVRLMVAALRIGGWLLVEEPDFSSLRAVDAEHPLAEFFNRKDREISERVMAHSSGYDAYIGCRLRGLLEEAGLADIGNEGRTMISRGGELHARMRCMALQAFMERGLLSQAEFAELERVYSDPSFSYIMPTMFAAWGKRPAN